MNLENKISSIKKFLGKDNFSLFFIKYTKFIGIPYNNSE